MRSYCTAQGTIPNLLGQNMMEDSMRKKKCIYACLGHFAVQWKLTRHCRSTLLQFKRKREGKKTDTQKAHKRPYDYEGRYWGYAASRSMPGVVSKHQKPEEASEEPPLRAFRGHMVQLTPWLNINCEIITACCCYSVGDNLLRRSPKIDKSPILLNHKSN